MAQELAVLIVEDSEDDALLITRELRRSGFDPLMRRVDTADAMRAALAERAWDLVLADYRMPRFSGPLALEALRESGLDIPFILVSATVGEEAAVAMMKAGAHDFVLKHSLGRLGAAVARELRDAEVRRRRRWADAALEILAEAGKLVVESAQLDVIQRRAATICVPRLADWCVLYYAHDRGSITDVTAVACRPEIDEASVLELATRYPPKIGADDPLFGNALLTHAPQLMATIGDPDLARIARDERHLQLLRALEPRSLMIIPQVARGGVIGLLVLAAQRRRYTEADLGVASELGRRVELVAENARLSRSREEFISTAIHEIKTPISVIKMSVQLMQQLDPAQRDARMPDLFERLDRQCNRLERLVTEVLEVSRLDLKRLTLSRRPIDLGALVERIVGEMRDVSSRHRFVVLRNDAIMLDADPDRIEQVLTNLLSNAIKYSPTGGDVEIESRRERNEALVSVRDHGIGIPLDRQGRIFERFYRAHVGTPYEHTSSLGVGLYLSHEFIARHGGRMWFESKEGVGSTFGFSLPLAPKDGE